MEKREESAILMDKLTQLNELEMKKSTVLAVIFQKTTQEIKEKKMQDLKKSFEEQIKYYDQYLEDYEEDTKLWHCPINFMVSDEVTFLNEKF